MLTYIISSFIASFGFGILFHIRGNKLILAAIAGTIGSVVYSICIEMNMTSTTAMFLASVSFSVFSEICARICKAPVTTFIIVALIPLVPGGGMYYTMLEAVKGEVLLALEKAFETIAQAGALALGIIFVSSVTKMLFTRKRKLVK